MKKGIRRVIVLLLALSMVFTTTGLPAFADESEPVSGDGAAVEEQIAQPAEEASFDNSTTLPDGEYEIGEDYYVFEGGSGKLQITCTKVTVTDGKAYGSFTTTSPNLTHVYLGHTESEADDPQYYDPETDTAGANVYKVENQAVTLPVRVNEKVNIAGRTTAMSNPHWVQYNYTIRIDEPEASALEQVLASIDELSNDPREFTADDAESVEAIQAAYEALSEEDQATVDNKTGHPSGDGQSYGRVLEAALWAVRSFSTDTSTTLDDGTYTTTTEPAVSSVSDKGKSDSSRVRNWWVEKVVVENGQATAYIYVTSGAATASKLTSYPSVWIGGQSVERTSDNCYPIPVDLNGTTYFGGVSSSMPRPIMYKLDTTIEEPAVIELAVDKTNAGMMKPASTAYLKGEKTIILPMENDSFTDLYVGDGREVNEEKTIALAANNTFTFDIDSFDTEMTIAFKSKKSKSWVNKKVTVSKVNSSLVIVDDKADYTAVDAAMAKVPEDLSIYTEDTRKAVEDAVAAVKTGKNSVEQAAVDAMAQAINDAVAALKVKPFAYDGDEVNFINKEGKQFGMFTPQDGTTCDIVDNQVVIHYVPKNKTTYRGFNWDSIDKSIYLDSSAEPEADVTFNADGTFDITLSKDYCGYAHPVAVIKKTYSNGSWTSGDQYYFAIPSYEHFIEANYSAVDAAIAKVPKDMSKYTDASVKAVNDAVNAVVRGKMAIEQTAVDNMAKAINNAVAGLKLKEVKQGWKKENGSWYYYTNGTAAKNTWKKDSKGWCYLGSDGKMITNGWAKDSHGWCWIGANGYMVEQTKWIKSGGNWYHITKGYRDASKWMKDSKGWCYLGKDGKMVTNGWAKDSHGWCWMGSNGYWTKSKWVKDKGEWYYIKSNHYMAANEWAKDSHGWMYMAKNGKATKSKWIKDKGEWYYLKDNGYMATGTLKIGSKTYTFASSGRWVK